MVGNGAEAGQKCKASPGYTVRLSQNTTAETKNEMKQLLGTEWTELLWG